jgi:hypothetical protein
MDTPYPFAHLSLTQLWPKEEPTPSLDEAAGVPLSPEMTLDICVRRLRLFRDCVPPNIREVRIDEKHQNQWDFPCRDREQLITRIVEALAEYEFVLTKLPEDNQKEFEERMGFLTGLQSDYSMYQGLFQSPKGRWGRGIALGERVSAKKFEESRAVMERVIRALHAHRFSLSELKGVMQVKTIGGLYGAFDAYGPLLKWTRPVYTNEALYAAIFTILEAFGLEKTGAKAGYRTNGGRRVAHTVKKLQQRVRSSVQPPR